MRRRCLSGLRRAGTAARARHDSHRPIPSSTATATSTRPVRPSAATSSAVPPPPGHQAGRAQGRRNRRGGRAAPRARRDRDEHHGDEPPRRHGPRTARADRPRRASRRASACPAARSVSTSRMLFTQAAARTPVGPRPATPTTPPRGSGGAARSRPDRGHEAEEHRAPPARLARIAVGLRAARVERGGQDRGGADHDEAQVDGYRERRTGAPATPNAIPAARPDHLGAARPDAVRRIGPRGGRRCHGRRRSSRWRSLHPPGGRGPRPARRGRRATRSRARSWKRRRTDDHRRHRRAPACGNGPRRTIRRAWSMDRLRDRRGHNGNGTTVGAITPTVYATGRCPRATSRGWSRVLLAGAPAGLRSRRRGRPARR